MCLIIHNPEGLAIDFDLIDAASFLNPHGFGITYLDTVETIKTMDYGRIEKLASVQRPFVAHWRYATAGKVGKANCHPFPIGKDKGILYQNGTVKSLASPTVCDTKRVADLLNKTPQEFWPQVLKMSDARFCHVSPSGDVKRYGKWHEHDGLYLSKLDVLDCVDPACGFDDDYDYFRPKSKPKSTIKIETPWEEDLPLAVYGTLKKGFGNHRLLEGAKFLGDARSTERLLMEGIGFPYLYAKPDKKRGKIVHFELYSVSDPKMRARLDQLEGTPDHYSKGLIELSDDSGEIFFAQTYFAQHAPPENADWLESF